MFWRLEPFLLGVVHTILVVNKVVGADANEVVVRFRVLFFHKVHIVGSYDFHSMLLCQLHQYGVHLSLYLIYMLISTWFFGLMALYLDVVVFAKEILVPLDSLFCCLHVAFHYFLW